MGYSLYDINGQEVTPADLQNKGAWCDHGASKEVIFVQRFGTRLGLEINPAKAKDPYAPDLAYLNGRGLADLKTQNTPFFRALKDYGIDPQYAVTFNTVDRRRYLERYPDIDIYYWVDWQAVRFEGRGGTIVVQAMAGVWKIAFRDLNALCDSANVHAYQQRRRDKGGNARDSFVLDLQNKAFRRVA